MALFTLITQDRLDNDFLYQFGLAFGQTRKIKKNCKYPINKMQIIYKIEKII